MKVVQGLKPQAGELEGETPTMRLFALLEVIASKQERVSLQRLVEETGAPKPTLHRMLQQLEGAGLLQREGDGRQYATGARLRRLAENLLLNDSHHGARHAVLRHLVEEVGESCNIRCSVGFGAPVSSTRRCSETRSCLEAITSSSAKRRIVGVSPSSSPASGFNP
jgi:IclR family acetate operon transcriptional repressor